MAQYDASVTPTIVLLPGMDGTGELFAAVVAALSIPALLLQVRPKEAAGEIERFCASLG